MSGAITPGDLGLTMPEVTETASIRDADLNPTTPDFSESIMMLNAFLRGEIAAAETYRMAIDKFNDGKHLESQDVALLQSIQDEHGRAAQVLRERIRDIGGDASDSSGAWGAWAKFTMGAAKLFGDAATLKSLKENEEHGLRDYRDGLDALDESSAALVEGHLIPIQIRHVAHLDALLCR